VHDVYTIFTETEALVMDAKGKRLPIGIQDFEKLITGDYLYVDKTRYIYELAHGDGAAYFLSRPRRFGKSLFLSSLKAYFEGRKELFRGLDIERLEEGNAGAWQEYPVFYFDFNKNHYREESALTDGKPDATKMKPICFDTCAHVYRIMGDAVAAAFSCGKELM
jgi:hypothetical protein